MKLCYKHNYTVYKTFFKWKECMRAIKYIGYFVIGLVALVLILFCALVLFFDPNNYKADIERIAKEKANIHLTINGDIRWTFYPWLGVSIQDTSIASVETPDMPFAKVQELDLSVRLLPLLKRQIKMNDINIDGLVVDLQRDEEGHTNWAKVGEITKPNTASVPSTSTSSPDTQTTEDNASSSKVEVDILSVTMNNSKFRYRDIITREEYTINNIHLSTGAIHDNAPTLVQLSADFASKNPAVTTNMQLQGKFSYDLARQYYQVTNLNLSSNVTGAIFNGKTVKLIADGNLTADLNAGVAQWGNLEFGVDVFKVTGHLKVTDLLKNPHVEGHLMTTDFSMQKLLDDIGVTLPAMANRKALSKVGFSTDLAGGMKNLTLDNVTIKVDDTTLTGKIAITDFATQAVKIALVGDSINVDNYLPPDTVKQVAQTSTSKTDGKTVAVSDTKPIWSNDVLFDLRNLQGKNFDISVSMGQLIIKKLPWKDMVLKVNAANGIVSLQDAGGKLFTGSAKLTGQVDVKSSSMPKIELRPMISNIPLGNILVAFDQETLLKGNINLNGILKTSGVSQYNLIKNLNGNLNLVINDGAILGENFEYQVCREIAKVRNEKLTTQFNRTETKFNQLKGTLTITNGVANNQDLIIAIAGFQTKGKGTINLINMMIDYSIGLTLQGDQAPNGDAACKVNKDVASIEFPVRCKGSLLAGGNLCAIDVDKIGDIAIDLGKAKVKEKAKEEVLKGIEKLDKKGKLKDAPALKGLIKGVLK